MGDRARVRCGDLFLTNRCDDWPVEPAPFPEAGGGAANGRALTLTRECQKFRPHVGSAHHIGSGSTSLIRFEIRTKMLTP